VRRARWDRGDALNLIDTPTKRVLSVRPGKPRAVIVHGTGETDLDKLIAYYSSADGLGPHYLVEPGGTVRQFARETLTAYHCKIDPAEARLYQQGYAEWSCWTWRKDQPFHVGEEFTGYRTWRDTWRNGKGLQSPLDLVTGAHPNSASIGIELQSLLHPTDAVFTREQYQALAELLTEVSDRHGILLSRDHLLGHYDCSPMRRSTGQGGYDPGEKFNWLYLYDLLAKLRP
jgi:N-acetyl-anhydromuramyl-L-alanine amidase AmpD